MRSGAILLAFRCRRGGKSLLVLAIGGELIRRRLRGVQHPFSLSEHGSNSYMLKVRPLVESLAKCFRDADLDRQGKRPGASPAVEAG